MIWRIALGVILMSFFKQGHSENIKIVTIDSPLQHVLKAKTEDIQTDELALAKEIANKLFSALRPYFPNDLV